MDGKAVGGINAILEQCRRPSGWLGRFTLWRMNLSHSRVTDWGLAHIAVDKRDTVLDVGCGGGATVGKLASMAAEGKVYGVDHSETSVAAAAKRNARWVEIGRVEIRQGSVSHLPFTNSMFDVVTAVETHFFWPNLASDMREVLRVMKPGGRLIIIAEIYKGANTRSAKLAEKHNALTGMTLLSADEHRELFEKSGYTDVEIFEELDKGWICGVGRKPKKPGQARDGERGEESQSE